MKSSTACVPEQVHFYGRPLTPGLRKLQHVRSDTVLEVGCGDGAILAALISQWPASPHRIVIGIDHSLDRCLAGTTLVPSSRFVVGHGQQLPIRSETHDIALCDMLIEHVEDERGLLLELHRVLKTGSHLHLSTVGSTGRGWYWYRRNGRCVLDPDHVREYPSTEAVAELIRAARFQLVSAARTRIRFSAADLSIRLLLKARLLQPTPQLRAIFVRSPWMARLQRLLEFPVPGFYAVEVLARKP